MSSRDQIMQMVDAMPEYKVDGLLNFLRLFMVDQEDSPNAETIAAAQEVNEMIRTGSGQHFKGSAADLFAMLDAEGEEDA